MIDFVAAAAALLLLGQASASTAEPPAEAEVVVTGRPTREVIQAFVGALSAQPSQRDQRALWSESVCPGVIGLRAAQAQSVIDRIAIRAADLGLNVGESGCRPNVLIIVTTGAQSTARALVNEHRAALGYYDGATNTLGRDALRDFVETPRAARWWHVSNTVTVDGQVIPSTEDNGGEPVVVDAPSSTSRLNRSTRQDFTLALIIVDAQQLEGVQTGVLADYLVMASLAQLNSNADTSPYPTILNFFSERAAGRPGPSALTDWDLSYLRGLYGAPRNYTGVFQRRAIEREIERGLSGGRPGH